jgi:DeoR/GlpR family transcriptional regulator of sugar metabolism
MEADTDRALVAAAQRIVVIADSTKWGTVGIASIASLPQADVLITDSRLPEETRTRLRELVGELIVVEVEA